uniref:ATP synthase subunit a n=1 Tax=Brachionichthys hirsutus TaxID=412623 RepID=D3KRF1_9TELE|nr:ATPase subunit 6 [Brachionichthys hirsutus]
MALNLFNQFLAPQHLGIPLTLPALIFPFILASLPPHPLWLSNRLFNLRQWLFLKGAHDLFTPLKKAGYKWIPLMVALLTYITLLNTLGLLPYTFTPTTQLSITLSLATPLWLMTIGLGLKHQPSKTLAHLLPQGTPTALIPALVAIETISLLIRPLALGVRLAANLTAGHLLMQLTAMASFILLPSLPPLAALTGLLLVLLTLLEIAVALIQPYVFVLLLTL